MKIDAKPLSRLRVVLDHTSHPGNIGSAARAMKTMGLNRLYLVAPTRFPDPEAEALACDARDVLEHAQVVATLDDALQGCAYAAGFTARRRGLSHPTSDLAQAAPHLMELASQQEVALVFGNETYGLSNEELSKCQLVVSIPTDEAYTSLNLASAVQIVAYELHSLALTRGAIPPTASAELAQLQDIELFYQRLEQTLIDIAFLDPSHPKRLMPRIRRLFARTALEKDELNILMGVLKQINLSRVKS